MQTMKPALTGLTLRAYAGESDLPDIVRIENAELEADGVPGRSELEGTRAYYRHVTPQFEAARDVTIASVDGDPVAYAYRSWRDTHDGEYREYLVNGYVHPDWRRRGIGSHLLRHNEQRARELAAMYPSDRRQVSGAWSGETQIGRQRLLERNGYSQVRWFFDMTRPHLDDIELPALPAGLEIRSTTDAPILPIWRALVESFQDHWGGGDDSEENLKRFTESPNHDPSLWVVAYDGDEVAGGIINGIEREENEMLGLQRGWLHSVFTRRPWRKRGLASALIGLSLVRLRERGMTSAVLGVDADNPTGALGLYERAGFAVSYRDTAWRKPLEP